MRKKSHISLAWFIMNSEGMEAFKEHKKSFYVGSVLPDCIPSFLVRKHTFEDSFSCLEEEVRKLVSHFDPNKGFGRFECKHLGVITHYVSDYFTFPHNSNYPGSLKDHCYYEEDLKHAFRAYVRKDEVQRKRIADYGLVREPGEILQFVRDVHDLYMRTESNVKRDCDYIVEVVYAVVDALVYYLESLYNGVVFDVSEGVVYG